MTNTCKFQNLSESSPSLSTEQFLFYNILGVQEYSSGSITNIGPTKIIMYYCDDTKKIIIWETRTSTIYQTSPLSRKSQTYLGL